VEFAALQIVLYKEETTLEARAGIELTHKGFADRAGLLAGNCCLGKS